MEGEVSVRPPCFGSIRLGNQEPHSRISPWPLARLFLLKVLCLLAVTFRRLVIHQPHNDVLGSARVFYSAVDSDHY